MSFPINSAWKIIAKKFIRTDKSLKYDYVSKTFVEKELKCLKRHKATGTDDFLSN